MSESLFAGGGDMGALMRSTDWSKTKLGSTENWPRSLRTMLGVMLGNRFPMMIWWGPNLWNFYNDAYRPILRDKHPQSLAAPAAELWAEIWDFAGPLARGIMEGGPATWMEDVQLFIKNGDISEETYFTFSYSPIPGDDGKVGGLLNTVQETTMKVRSERQIRMLRDLASRASEAKSEDEAYSIAAEVLSANELDIPFVSFYVLDDQSDNARLVAAGGWKEYEGLAKPSKLAIKNGGDGLSRSFAEVVRTSREVIIDDLAARLGLLPMGRWNARPERAIVLPIIHVGSFVPHALLMIGLSPHRTFDESYRRLLQAVADQVRNVASNARAYEAEKKRAEALAEIDRAKTAFFSNVSHEFRTPLTLMLGPLEDELAERVNPLPPPRHERLEAAHRNALRLLKLVNALLDFSRIEAGRMEASYKSTDLSAYTAELASAFQSALDKAGLTLTVDCPPLPEPAYVDREMWEKIVLNLISNALKHTFKGGIEVRLRKNGGEIELTVADTGIGIPEKELPTLFERFHRVKGAKSRTHEGTGIGLALVRDLAQLHGGSVRVESREGEGSRFFVTIKAGKDHLPADHMETSSPPESPVVQAAAYVGEALQWTSAEVPSSETNGQEIRQEKTLEEDGVLRPRILLADDNADMRAYIRRLLAERYEVQAVSDGNAALAAARKDSPDLILTDVMMPGLDGFGLLRALRADTHTRNIPVIILSARAGEESSVEGLDAGADDYLVKPFSARELLARVRTHLELNRVRRQWIGELERLNKELETFSYSVSHDLRAPLRSIDGFSQALLQGYGDKLDEGGRKFILHVRDAVKSMGELIEDMLRLAKVTRQELSLETVDLSIMVQELIEDLRQTQPARSVEVVVPPALIARADRQLLRAALQNLLGNAWKFTSKKEKARIEFGVLGQDKGKTVYFVRDDGAGFDMRYGEKLFGAFQRLHSQEEFPGTGVGLATVQRVIHRHGGRIWAESEPDRGATFYFTL